MSEIPTSRIHTILVQARKYLTTYGWQPGPGNIVRRHPTCLGIAIQWGNPFQECNVLELRACAEALGFPRVAALTRWNDGQESIEPVLARLDEAIANTAPESELRELVPA